MQIKVNRNILASNEEVAALNKDIFREKGILVLNLMGSPGGGKTTFLEKTIELVGDSLFLAVIEGDIYTRKDAERIEKHGVPVKQINTGGACHLDGKMINSVIDELPLDQIDLLVIENVGNLVCPVEFYLGEDMKVAVLSIVEGDDKPMKYPLIFKESSAVILNKIDLIPYTYVNMVSMREDLLNINPDLAFFETSCREGTGLDSWVEWLKTKVAEKKAQF